MSEQLVRLKELAAKRSVLFVEDDEKIIKSMKSVLESIFGNTFICMNGEEGLLSYQNNTPDLILTDIQMPKMNGIVMAEKIRQNDEDVPIIIMSAYSDEDHLMDSIYLGIDRYIKKPIDDEKFFAALLHALTKIENEEKALAYQREKLARAINEAADTTLKETMNIFPSPAFVYDEKKELYFINVHGLELFSPQNLQEIQEKQSIDSFLIKKRGALESLFDISNKGLRENKLILQTPSGRQRVYLVHYTTMTTQEKALDIYTLSDITRAEYENQKSKNLSAHLHEVIRFYRKQRKDCIPFVSEEQKQEKDFKEEEPKSYETIRLGAMHYEDKMDAKTYMQEIDEGVKEEMDELEEIEKELIELLEDCAESFSHSNIENIATKIEAYARTIGLLMDFEDISFSLDKLTTFLRNLDTQTVNSKKLLLLLGSIADDLRMWRQSIFVAQNTVDIHYLDASLLSSCLQIETEFGESSDANSQSDELELF